MSYLLRLVLPDRPGALGAVATALGRSGIDIASIAIVERGDTGAVDDLIVMLPPGGLADTVVTAAQSVPGVQVESLRPFLDGGSGIQDDLQLVDAMAARPDESLELLTDLVAGVFHADWSVLLEWVGPDDVRVLEASGGAPSLGGDDLATPERIRATPPWMPLAAAARLERDDRWCPARWADLGMELAAAPVGSPRLAILVGRPGGPTFRASEVDRLGHLAGIAATVARNADT
ncbi:MAG: ACT domain-containing protein [Frankia sp.]